MNQTIYQVAPRYTGGSPAQVNEAMAMMVAAAEKKAYQDMKVDGAVPRTHDKGLDGIAECLVETPKGWDVLDLITEKRHTRPFQGGPAERVLLSRHTAIRRRKMAQGAALLKLANEIQDLHSDITSSQDGMPEDPGLTFVLMDLKAMMDRLNYLGTIRAKGLVD